MEHSGVDYQAVARALVEDLEWWTETGWIDDHAAGGEAELCRKRVNLERKVAEATIAIELGRGALPRSRSSSTT